MSVTIHVGDCIDVLRTLPAESVHCVVTSPPYYGLRDYGTAEWEGGDAECDHERPNNNANTTTMTGGTATLEARHFYRATCAKCGAARVDRQIGLEDSPDAYVAKLVEVFREVRRVLHRTGVCWLNLGDSYFSSTATQGRNESKSNVSTLSGHGDNGRSPALDTQQPTTYRRSSANLKPKDLMMIPARVALALQADGWWLRSQVIWHKPNAMPESVTDRPTTDYECVYLLAKEARYFYDADAIREPHADESINRMQYDFNPNRGSGSAEVGKRNGSWKPEEFCHTAGRNKRTVWTIPTRPFSEAHFATFPVDLVEPMIRAGTSERGACPECGCQWERVVEKVGERATHGVNNVADDARGRHGSSSVFYSGVVPVTETTGWRPTCDHDAEPIPAVCLDPFFGAGTVGLVCDRLGRDAIGIELNESYAQMAARRIYEDAGMFADVEVLP